MMSKKTNVCMCLYAAGRWMYASVCVYVFVASSSSHTNKSRFKVLGLNWGALPLPEGKLTE